MAAEKSLEGGGGGCESSCCEYTQANVAVGLIGHSVRGEECVVSDTQCRVFLVLRRRRVQ